MDYKSMISARRREAINLRENRGQYTLATEFEEDADAIKTLLAERDAALEELRSIGCEVCAHLCDYSFNSPCCTCGDADNNWQWRGPQKQD